LLTPSPTPSQFGGQPYFNDFLSRNFKKSFDGAFGEKNGKAMMAATAGSCVLAVPRLPVHRAGRADLVV